MPPLLLVSMAPNYVTLVSTIVPQYQQVMVPGTHQMPKSEDAQVPYIQ